ncbi:MAG: nuclear transport factor 2 family protein [Acidobacteriia bacterium]|nr:nuclear transport factor 2 family protein [Terriglobia bacterium]
MGNSDAMAVAKAYFAAVNESRIEDLAQIFAEGARMEYPQVGVMTGREAIRNFYAWVFRSYGERDDRVTRFFSDGANGVAAEIHFEGKTAKGAPVVFDAVDLFRVENGHIVELKIFFDAKKVIEMAGEAKK